MDDVADALVVHSGAIAALWARSGGAAAGVLTRRDWQDVANGAGAGADLDDVFDDVTDAGDGRLSVMTYAAFCAALCALVGDTHDMTRALGALLAQLLPARVQPPPPSPTRHEVIDADPSVALRTTWTSAAQSLDAYLAAVRGTQYLPSPTTTPRRHAGGAVPLSRARGGDSLRRGLPPELARSPLAVRCPVPGDVVTPTRDSSAGRRHGRASVPIAALTSPLAGGARAVAAPCEIASSPPPLPLERRGAVVATASSGRRQWTAAVVHPPALPSPSPLLPQPPQLPPPLMQRARSHAPPQPPPLLAQQTTPLLHLQPRQQQPCMRSQAAGDLATLLARANSLFARSCANVLTHLYERYAAGTQAAACAGGQSPATRDRAAALPAAVRDPAAAVVRTVTASSAAAFEAARTDGRGADREEHTIPESQPLPIAPLRLGAAQFTHLCRDAALLPPPMRRWALTARRPTLLPPHDGGSDGVSAILRRAEVDVIFAEAAGGGRSGGDGRSDDVAFLSLSLQPVPTMREAPRPHSPSPQPPVPAWATPSTTHAAARQAPLSTGRGGGTGLDYGAFSAAIVALAHRAYDGAVQRASESLPAPPDLPLRLLFAAHLLPLAVAAGLLTDAGEAAVPWDVAPTVRPPLAPLLASPEAASGVVPPLPAPASLAMAAAAPAAETRAPTPVSATVTEGPAGATCESTTADVAGAPLRAGVLAADANARVLQAPQPRATAAGGASAGAAAAAPRRPSSAGRAPAPALALPLPVRRLPRASSSASGRVAAAARTYAAAAVSQGSSGGAAAPPGASGGDGAVSPTEPRAAQQLPMQPLALRPPRPPPHPAARCAPAQPRVAGSGGGAGSRQDGGVAALRPRGRSAGAAPAGSAAGGTRSRPAVRLPPAPPRITPAVAVLLRAAPTPRPRPHTATAHAPAARRLSAESADGAEAVHGYATRDGDDSDQRLDASSSSDRYWRPLGGLSRPPAGVPGRDDSDASAGGRDARPATPPSPSPARHRAAESAARRGGAGASAAAAAAGSPPLHRSASHPPRSSPPGVGAALFASLAARRGVSRHADAGGPREAGAGWPRDVSGGDDGDDDGDGRVSTISVTDSAAPRAAGSDGCTGGGDRAEDDAVASAEAAAHRAEQAALRMQRAADLLADGGESATSNCPAEPTFSDLIHDGARGASPAGPSQWYSRGETAGESLSSARFVVTSNASRGVAPAGRNTFAAGDAGDGPSAPAALSGRVAPATSVGGGGPAAGGSTSERRTHDWQPEAARVYTLRAAPLAGTSA